MYIINKLKYYFFYIVFSIILINTISAQIIDNSEVQTILEGVKYGDSLVENGHGTLIFEKISPDSLNEIIKLKKMITENKMEPGVLNTRWYEKRNEVYTFKNEKRKLNISDEEIYSFDGEKASRLYLYTDSRGLIRPTGFISENLETIFNYYLPIKYMTYFYPFLEKSLSGSVNGYNSKIYSIIKEKDKNILCDVVKISIKYDSYEDSISYYFAKSLNYRPIKIIEKYKNTLSICEITYRNINNIFFPEIITENIHNNNILTKKSLFYFNNDWELNSSIPDSLFEIFPKGLNVLDERVGQRYIIK
jgi:hypothetical protein